MEIQGFDPNTSDPESALADTIKLTTKVRCMLNAVTVSLNKFGVVEFFS